jgi:acetyl esterase/lipase
MDPRDVLTRPAPPPDHVLRYGDHPDHVIDLRLPRAQDGPLIVFLHGGFWRAAYDRVSAGGGPLAADLAARGHPVASVEYRRVGQEGGGWRGTFDDVERALAVLPALAARYADPADPILAGHSAGGHLALRYADAAAGVLALAPVADLVLAYGMGLGGGAVGELLGGGPADVPDRYEYAEPGVAPVPTVIVHGDADDRVPLAVAERYAERAGTRCELHVVSGGDHFAVIDPLSSAWPSVVSAVSLLVTLVDGQPKRR